MNGGCDQPTRKKARTKSACFRAFSGTDRGAGDGAGARQSGGAHDSGDRRRAPDASRGGRAARKERFTREELEKLLAPIALYPDPLLAQMLPASAYPVQIVQAQRWLDKNKALVAKNDYSGIDNQNWDPAVKALARFPDVIKMMSADLDWTTDLGDAEVNQPQDVAEVIQDLRAKAEAAGTLKTTDQQTVERVEASAPPGAGAPQGSTAPQAEASYISIQPTDPSTVYVPTYDPAAVYQPYTGDRASPGLRGGHRGRGAVEQQLLELGNGRDLSADLGRLFGLAWRRQ